MRNYATENNTIKVTCTTRNDRTGRKPRTTEFVIWKSAEERYDNLFRSHNIAVFGEIYRRLRKIPEYDGSVAILFAQSEYAICKRLKISQEDFDSSLRELIENEIVNVVYSAMEYKVLSVDRSIFLTNYIYYKECGTDSKECADFSMKYEVKAER